MLHGDRSVEARIVCRDDAPHAPAGDLLTERIGLQGGVVVFFLDPRAWIIEGEGAWPLLVTTHATAYRRLEEAPGFLFCRVVCSPNLGRALA